MTKVDKIINIPDILCQRVIFLRIHFIEKLIFKFSAYLFAENSKLSVDSGILDSHFLDV